TLINAAAGHVTYRKSNRYSVSSSEPGSSSLSISDSRLSDSGFYHCRVERPGLFNDQTFSLHLIIISSSRSVIDSPATESSELSAETLNAPRTATSEYKELQKPRRDRKLHTAGV
ncbi:hepatitis A virus cellular receptor 1 homolog, partial [Scomber japonicus]|uniref:hepatitis A virus cellular receptor 1 homolog n=1 Tax=Scomber japonicus TaxID=13676 RepID=UPI002306737C